MEIYKNVTEIFNDFDLTITQCDISDMITEISRFMSHIVLIHILTFMIDRKDELFGQQVFKTLFATACAVLIYHVLFKKFIGAKLKNMQSECNDFKEKQKKEQEKKV